MVAGGSWERGASLARSAERAGLDRIVLTGTSRAPWMSLAAAGMATTRLGLATGIAVAFPLRPMVTAQLAWELADNTAGRFRPGLASQVEVHVESCYATASDPPGPRLPDYVGAVRARLAAFRGDQRLDHQRLDHQRLDHQRLDHQRLDHHGPCC